MMFFGLLIFIISIVMFVKIINSIPDNAPTNLNVKKQRNLTKTMYDDAISYTIPAYRKMFFKD
jgi:hypothetical protein